MKERIQVIDIDCFVVFYLFAYRFFLDFFAEQKIITQRPS